MKPGTILAVVSTMAIRPRARTGLAAIAVTLGAGATACVSVAPPIRAGQYGAPGRMAAGVIEAGANGAYGPETYGGPTLGYGGTDQITIEAGGEIGSLPRGIGYLGLRYTPLHPEGRRRAFTLDLEGGAGAGVGGNRCDADTECEPPRLDWRRPAGGGYLGLGVGGKIGWFWPWLRLRTQVSAANHVPVTSFTTAFLGVQFSVAEFAHLYLGTGGVHLVNQHINTFGWQWFDAGLSFTLATPRAHRIPHERRFGRGR